MKNLYKHIDNIQNKFGLNIIVAINKYNTDTEKELEYVQKELTKQNIESSIVESWAKGGEGAIDISNKIIQMCEKKDNFKYIYDLEDSIENKIEKIAKQIYGAKKVTLMPKALNKIEKFKKMGYTNLPICIAKTQYSFSDNPKDITITNNFEITIKDLDLKLGAGFIVAYAGNILTMPGLPKVPAAENIDINENEEIVGIF